MRHMQGRYEAAGGRREKGRLLTEVSENLSCHRKHANRRLRGKIVDLEKPWRHRDPIYPERLGRLRNFIIAKGPKNLNQLPSCLLCRLCVFNNGAEGADSEA